MKLKLLALTIMVIMLSGSLFTACGKNAINNKIKSEIKEIKPIQTLSKIFNFIEKMEPGDIIIHLPGKESQYGHCRLFTGNNNLKNRYSFVDSYFHVLGYSRSKIRVAQLFIILTLLWDYNGLILARVNATAEQKQNAIDFANLQVGKRFDFVRDGADKNFNPENKSVETANQWYCSELPWAAYFNCNNSFPRDEPEEGYVYGEGIDIDANNWTKDHNSSCGIRHSLVYPLDIIYDDDVEVVDIWLRSDRQFDCP